ncbi:hypothetical protein F5Y14DRAFT_401773 [Nemania sp. NC0429]|nr:hypothetical protein F5Y14DRAFT_401773 [Nemania sp. NC0429]
MLFRVLFSASVFLPRVFHLQGHADTGMREKRGGKKERNVITLPRSFFMKIFIFIFIFLLYEYPAVIRLEMGRMRWRKEERRAYMYERMGKRTVRHGREVDGRKRRENVCISKLMFHRLETMGGWVDGWMGIAL